VEDKRATSGVGANPGAPVGFHLLKIPDESLKLVLKGAGDFLARICLPAAEEFGLLLRDRVDLWRLRNLAAIATKAEALVGKLPGGDKLRAHPRMVWATIENGSWAEDELLRTMWAGLLASSCTPDGKDDSNVVYVNIVSQLTRAQARILDHACSAVHVRLSKTGLIQAAGEYVVEAAEAMRIAGVEALHDLDRDLDHMRSQGLLGSAAFAGGLDFDRPIGVLTPSPLALGLYARCHGCPGAPADFFKDRLLRDEVG
jgi:hypothetical protein